MLKKTAFLPSAFFFFSYPQPRPAAAPSAKRPPPAPRASGDSGWGGDATPPAAALRPGTWDVEMWKYRRVNKCVFFWGGLSVKSNWYRFSSYPGLTQGQCRLLITRWATHLALIHLRTQRPAMRIIVICHEEKGWWECWELGDGQQGPSISSGDATLPSK